MRRIVSLFVITSVLLLAALPASAEEQNNSVPVLLSDELLRILPLEDTGAIRRHMAATADHWIFRIIAERERERIRQEELRAEEEKAHRLAEAEAKAEAERQKVPSRTYDYAFGCAPSEVARCDANRALGYHAIVERGWSNDQFQCLDTLWGRRESGWDNTLQNNTSTAYGVAQFLDSTWGNYGIAKTSDPALQIEAGLRYIKDRYNSPCRALAFSRATVSGDSSLAPSGLQGAARYWISRGYKGY